METLTQQIIIPITSQPWWRKAFDLYSDALIGSVPRRVLVLYNADIDGFAASYFVFKSLNTARGHTPQVFQARPVWNYEYDFRWVPKLVRETAPDLIICVDIPIIQEPNILLEVGTTHRMVIYDHHVIPPNLPTPPSNVIFINPRAFSLTSDDFPASAFTGAAALSQGALVASDILILAAGLKGDWALARYPDLLASLKSLSVEFGTRPLEHDSALGKFTSRLNALFRAHPGGEFANLHARLAHFLDTQHANTAVVAFTDEFHLVQAAALVQNEVSSSIREMTRSALSETINGVFVSIPKVKTFCVGIIATILAKQNVAPVVVIGFESEDRVQFELRVSQTAGIDLTAVLREQLTEFRPLTSGGHPVAAGALVKKCDTQLFAESFRNALARLGGVS